jgi:hypothetical protein
MSMTCWATQVRGLYYINVDAISQSFSISTNFSSFLLQSINSHLVDTDFK